MHFFLAAAGDSLALAIEESLKKSKKKRTILCWSKYLETLVG